MTTLYRQYRPQIFADVSGQKHIISTLKQAILKNKISHAYLFQGPRGTGKTTTARILAKRLNCLKPIKEEPCTKCDNCESAQESRMIDLIEIDAASNRGIDDIRALRETINLSPSMGKYKIYIIDEVHMLTNEAFAALLKTLEEPVKHAVFILATTELHKVPPTILSRCQVYRFKRAGDEEMKNRLEDLLKKEKRQADPEAVNFIISRSDGCYRDAESLLGQMLTFYDDKLSRDTLSDFLGLPSPDITENLVQAMIDKNSSKALEIAHHAYEGGFDPEQLIEEAIRYSRDNVLKAVKNSISTAQLTTIIRSFLQAKQDLAYVPQPLIALQLAILSVCGTTTSPTAPVQSTPRQPPSNYSKPILQVNEPPVTYQSAPEKNIPSAPSESSPLSVEKMKSLWEKLLVAVKKVNPVASTFLLASEPTSVSGDTATLTVTYSIHHNFLDKPNNKSLVASKLSELVGTPVKIIFDIKNVPASEANNPKAKQEEELYNNVKDIFGK